MIERNNVSVKIAVNYIKCNNVLRTNVAQYPYLWPLFFTVDGVGTFINQQRKLTGNITVFRTNGEHKNITSRSFENGSMATIPNRVGTMEIDVSPIVVTDL